MKGPVIHEIEAKPALDVRAVPRRIGLVVTATDHTSERDFARMVPAEAAAVYVSRVPYANPTTPDNLRAMEPDLARAAALILPDEQIDVLCYSCTSAAILLGDAAVETALHRAKPGAQVVTPPLAARTALQALGARRISLLTPYTRAVSEPVAAYFGGHGFDVLNLTCFGLDDDRVMARVQPRAIVEAAREATHGQAEALFISCTALRAAQVAAEIEAAIGRPVVTANQASVWLSLRLAGIAAPIGGQGRLFALSGREAA